ncbi:MAG: hypothetical protein VYA30_03760 [Myxococcota bacterium]|nr:hypothetical protein [Myxococcota bacterium]
MNRINSSWGVFRAAVVALGLLGCDGLEVNRANIIPLTEGDLGFGLDVVTPVGLDGSSNRPPDQFFPVDAGEGLDFGLWDEQCADGRESRTGEGRLGVSNCRIVRNGNPAGLLRGVIVSADSLTTPLSTSPHSEADFQALRQQGIDYVWLLIPLKGLLPIEGAFDAAFMGRICAQAAAAYQVGLDLLIGVYADISSGRSDDGAPAWVDALSDDSDVRADLFWEGHSQHLTESWRRLVDTCGNEIAIAGVLPLVNPKVGGGAASMIAVRSRFEEIFELVEDRYGPVLRLVQLVDGPNEPARYWENVWPDTVYMPSVLPDADGQQDGLTDNRLLELLVEAKEFGLPLWLWGVAATRVDQLERQLALLDEKGVFGSIWHDGSSGMFGLRNADWSYNALFSSYLARPIVRAFTGYALSSEITRERTIFQWHSRQGAVELFEFEPGWHGPDCSLESDDDLIVDLSYAYDPVTNRVTAVVVAPPGLRRLIVKGVR